MPLVLLIEGNIASLITKTLDRVDLEPLLIQSIPFKAGKATPESFHGYGYQAKRFCGHRMIFSL